MDLSELPEELRQSIQKMIDEEVRKQTKGFGDALETLKLQVEKSNATGQQEDRATIVAFSGEMDTLFAACTIASGAAAMGMEVSMYFTFWGLNAIRTGRSFKGKSLGEKMVAFMMPGGPASVPTSRMNMAGMGPLFFKHLMKQRNVEKLPNLVELIQELGVRMIACETSMMVMGVKREELLEGVEFGGVATYLEDAAKSKITLFI
ncbi:DsrE/DsrF/DrsH-like family protein [Rubripirellula sp.]|jgi:peroxiredoxin family protein|nr:DsrE/DsrF/DrsH-like family protein [Rubripirellula sp.]